MQPKKNNLNFLRQELRNRLLKIGMQIDSKSQAEDRYKVFKKGRGKTEEEDNLPSLQSFRSNNLFSQDYRKLVTSNLNTIAEQKQAQKALSKQIVRGVKCNNSVQSSRNCSPSQMKQQIHKKIILDARTLRISQKLPIVMNPQVPSTKQWSQTIRVQRIDRPVNVEDLQNDVKEILILKSQRSKTEERQKKTKMNKSSMKIKKSLGRQLAPWEGDVNRDSHMLFH